MHSGGYSLLYLRFQASNSLTQLGAAGMLLLLLLARLLLLLLHQSPVLVLDFSHVCTDGPHHGGQSSHDITAAGVPHGCQQPGGEGLQSSQPLLKIPTGEKKNIWLPKKISLFLPCKLCEK